MNPHSAIWPDGKIHAVEILDKGGAWFVTYENEHGHRDFIRKQNGRRKGFRSLDDLVPFLRVVHGVEKFSIVLA